MGTTFPKSNLAVLNKNFEKCISFNPKGPNAEKIIRNLGKDLSTKTFINVNYCNKSKQ